jgi:signal transduction histidine kinase
VRGFLNYSSHYFATLLNTEGFPPRWLCGQWTHFAGWLYIISDLAIWGAYMSIPVVLLYFIAKRKDIPFSKIFWLFAAFIFACGSTHLLDAIMFWWPAYRLTGLIYFATAVISWLTVFELLPIIPVALSLRSPSELQREIDERIKIEDALKQREERDRKISIQLKEYATQLENTNKELEAFSYSVSHDLRAPLRGIDGFSQALLEEYSNLLDEQGRHYLNRVRQSSQQMGQLIDDILQLSRLTRDEMKLESVDLSKIVKTITQELQELEPERQVDFVIEDGVIVQGDKQLLHAVMQNLLGNAWKYTSKHSTAQIKFGITEYKGRLAYFVKDDGAGFDMAYAGKLFGAFQRLHRTNEFPGTGVGLATVARIIHRHGGEVKVEAEIEKGATFYFTLGETLDTIGEGELNENKPA